MKVPSAIAFNSALIGSNLWPEGGEGGRYRSDSHHDSTPKGTWIANSHGQDPSAMIPAATDGPAAEDAATTRTLYPTPRPSCARGKMNRTSAPLTLMMPAPPRP